ncbi:MAG: hypothetical protein KKF44_01380 [Nanoarchaeota archaeon]|nr:hypothetical protein [Nanoarchaeota archaeon]
MDYTQLQRENKLASDLKKFKLTPSQDNKNPEPKPKCDDTLKQINTDLLRLIDSRFNSIDKEIRNIGFSVRRNEEKIVSLMEKMNELIKEFNDLKRSRRPVPMHPNSEPIEGNEQSEKRILDKPIDRNNVAPKDVSVEKYFYFGKKKK